RPSMRASAPSPRGNPSIRSVCRTSCRWPRAARGRAGERERLESKHHDPAASPEGGQHTMPMCDAYIPQGALSPSAERELLGRITDELLEHEGVDPTNERARPLAWVSVHRPEMYVAGAPAQAPHYRFICQVPEGQYNDERRAAVTAAMTQAVVEAEDGSWLHPERRRVRLHTRGQGRHVRRCGNDPQRPRHLRLRSRRQVSRGGRAGARCTPARGGRAASRSEENTSAL